MSDDIQVLVVDDELRMRHLLGKVLAKEGYAVQTSSIGADALKKAKKTPFEIVVTDFKMPGMDGIELLRAVKQVLPETTVILMTAFGSIDSAIQAMKEGAYHYITKPFKLEELLILPPLRERLEDIPLLADHFLRRYAQKFQRDILGIDRRTLYRKSRKYHLDGCED